jgi:uncharacterized membrane protein YGL010W
MTDADNWLERYEESHQDFHNPLTYWVAAPLLVFGLTGVLWNLPIPHEFELISPLLNWGTAFLMATTIYYFIISLSLAIGMLPFLLGLATVQLWLSNSGYHPLAISITFLIVGFIGIALGRAAEPRSVFQDLQLVMIAPVWLLSRLYRRFGIPI